MPDGRSPILGLVLLGARPACNAIAGLDGLAFGPSSSASRSKRARAPLTSSSTGCIRFTATGASSAV